MKLLPMVVALLGAAKLAAQAPPAVTGPAAVLMIVTPVPNRNFFLLTDNLENVLTLAGFQAPPGVSLLKAMATCQPLEPNCQKAMAGITAHGAAATRTDSTGKAAFTPVPAGTYYLIGASASAAEPMIWNLKVVLKPGANAMTLDQRNAAPPG